MGRCRIIPQLAEAYYGRSVQHADIFISQNKPSLTSQVPPLLTLGDVYFTVAPSYYMDFDKWRRIIYDHLFARKRNTRDYADMEPATLEELSKFYQTNLGTVMGLGTYHETSQTWRPTLPNTLPPPKD